ncbi:LIC_13387 family protein [Sorangium sp. So ce233]|uniref:LIC_13387 family protein n=1 Tax=Sorangium sp. So ce233 TaxID=3133290 RepID=UPI003F5F50B5
MGHLGFVALTRRGPAGPAQAGVVGAMQTHRVPLMGLTRDLYSLHVGFSVAMGRPRASLLTGRAARRGCGKARSLH